MALRTGERLGSYEITGPLGKGGMGEVYRGRDTKLDREVAVKVLPEALARDQERLVRFEREAKALAALNHANIAQIYAVEGNAFIMELVPGETLGDRIKRGAIPLEEALGIAAQMAAALDAAHEKGIVHRDFKPGNVMVTPDGVVKVLDFGLVGKAPSSNSDNGQNPEDSPTLTLAATQAGVIMGTAAYMAPEQAAGKTVDKRADIWAFGVVLWEMLTGKRLFEGETVSHVLAAVLTKEPDLSAIPPRVRPLLQRCLEKDPRKRLRDIGDAMGLVLASSMNPADARSRTQRPPSVWAWVAAGVMALGLAVLSFAHFREGPPAAAPMVRMRYAPEGVTIPGNEVFALSPDGRKFAFFARTPQRERRLFVRDFAELEARQVQGIPVITEQGVGLSWSPDGQWLVYFTQGQIYKVKAGGGAPQLLGRVSGASVGFAWNREGVILFGANTGPISRVSAEGGEITPVTSLDPELGDTIHVRPLFLPDGKHFLYQRVGRTFGTSVGSIDAKPGEQSKKVVVAEATHSEFVPSADGKSGQLVFRRNENVFAQPFDLERFELTGRPVRVAEDVGNFLSNSLMSVSPNGTLVYLPGESTSGSKLAWFDRQGNMTEVGEIAEAKSILGTTLAISPDGKRVAVDRSADGFSLWLLDFARPGGSRFTFNRNGIARVAAWSPDGADLIYSMRSDGMFDLYRRSTNGSGNDELILKSNHEKFVSDWSADGKFLLYQEQGASMDLMVLPMAGENRKAIPYLQTEFDESGGRFSPDAKWVAYQSNESGRAEVYVRPFPNANGGKWQVSQGGGSQPHWTGDGKELFFKKGGDIMSAAVSPRGPVFESGPAKALFNPARQGAPAGQWDVTPDGKRFLITLASGEDKSVPFTVVFNAIPSSRP